MSRRSVPAEQLGAAPVPLYVTARDALHLPDAHVIVLSTDGPVDAGAVLGALVRHLGVSRVEVHVGENADGDAPPGLGEQILGVLHGTDKPMSGAEVGDALGITRQKAVLELSALVDAAKVTRDGGRYTAV